MGWSKNTLMPLRGDLSEGLRPPDSVHTNHSVKETFTKTFTSSQIISHLSLLPPRDQFGD